MTSSVAAVAAEFREYLRTMSHYEETLALLGWDQRTGAPKRGADLRAQTIGTMSTELFRMSTSDRMQAFIQQLSEPDVWATLDPVLQGSVREVSKEFERNRKVPPERHAAFTILTSQAESAWEEARHESDFDRFQPYLERIVEMTNEFIDYRGYGETRYDSLLDQYEPGITVRVLDPLFASLRDETVSLLRAITSSPAKPNAGLLTRPFDVAKQRELSLRVLRSMGYDFASGRLDETVHPFMVTINRFDTRVTTKFVPDDLHPSLFGTIHEGGHALYEQGIGEEFIGTPLSSGASMGLHESQSRMWENMIGRSREYWEHHYKHVLELFPTQFADVPMDEFYRAVNDVRPSLIRIEADEVTYNLHIMIRYEIEKGLIHGTVRVKDLPEVWRALMRDYIGVVPETHRDGVLQDVHWSGGDFGYFPSYALGNVYAAQFFAAMARDLPTYREDIRRGDLQTIREWLRQNIHRHGKALTPTEIVKQVTGEELDARHLVKYLKDKFGQLYPA